MISERPGAALIVMTGRLMLEHDEANPTFFQTLAAFSAGATPAIVDYGNGAAFRFQLRVDTNLDRLGFGGWRFRTSYWRA